MVEVTNNPSESQYEIAVDGKRVGVMTYSILGDTVTVLHTEVDAELRGQGLGQTLVRAALDQIRAAGLLVWPRCPSVRAFIGEHPEYQDLVKAA